MRKRVVVVVVAVAVSLVVGGCATIGRLTDPNYFHKQSSMQLCVDLLSSPSYNINREARMQELSSRGENCSQYVGTAALQQQTNQQTLDAINRAVTPSAAASYAGCLPLDWSHLGLPIAARARIDPSWHSANRDCAGLEIFESCALLSKRLRQLAEHLPYSALVGVCATPSYVRQCLSSANNGHTSKSPTAVVRCRKRPIPPIRSRWRNLGERHSIAGFPIVDEVIW